MHHSRAHTGMDRHTVKGARGEPDPTKLPREQLRGGTLELSLSEAESKLLNAKGERFHAAELMLAQAQNALASAQRDYDQQLGRLQGAVEQLLEMKGIPTDGVSARFDPETGRVVVSLSGRNIRKPSE